MAEEKRGYWQWLESRWSNPDKDWKKAKTIAAGVDVGSVSSQAVIMTDGELYAYSSRRTGSDSADSSIKALDWALDGTGLTLENIHYTVGTGYGRVNIPFAKRSITEISCHALGANFIYGPAVRTVLDMGGQDCKAIHCDEKGKVIAFLMNDKCAAGTGRGVEVFADLVSVSINDVGELSLQTEEEPPPVSSTCVVFAKAEAIDLLNEGWPVSKVLAAYCSAMASRVVELLERIGMEPDFAITGGIAKNIGIVKRIQDKIGVKSLTTKYDPQIAGALGAALFARAILEKSQKK